MWPTYAMPWHWQLIQQSVTDCSQAKQWDRVSRPIPRPSCNVAKLCINDPAYPLSPVGTRLK